MNSPFTDGGAAETVANSTKTEDLAKNATVEVAKESYDFEVVDVRDGKYSLQWASGRKDSVGEDDFEKLQQACTWRYAEKDRDVSSDEATVHAKEVATARAMAPFEAMAAAQRDIESHRAALSDPSYGELAAASSRVTIARRMEGNEVYASTVQSAAPQVHAAIAFREAETTAERQRAAEQHPELTRAFAIEASMIALSKQIQGERAQDAFMARIRENISTDLAQGRPLVEVQLKDSARSMQINERANELEQTR